MYLKCFVLGDEIEVHGENRIRNLSNWKTVGQAVYGLWLFVAVFGGLSLSGAACDCLCLIVADCGCVWLCGGLPWLQTLCSFPMRFLRYFECKSVVTSPYAVFRPKAVVTHPMFVSNAISAVFRM